MVVCRPARFLLVAAALALATPGAQSQTPAPAPAPAQQPYEPQSGQAGKDVVWVPTPQSTVDAMLAIADVGPDDYLMDLGSGDGVTVIAAAKRGATAVGVEFNPDMVALAERHAREAGVAGKASFVKGDLFEADLSRATVITLFLLPDLNVRLRPKLLELRPGTRIVSNSFRMGEWQPDREKTVTPCSSWCTALLWVVPVRVAGTWQIGAQPLVLAQEYQVITGTLGTAPLTGRIDGETVTFTAGGRTFTGRADGDMIIGPDWAATKK